MGQKDKTALVAAGIALVLFALFQFAVFPVWDSMQEGRANLPIQEKKLEKYREVIQTAGVRKTEVSSVETRLGEAEAGLLDSKTAALASAELQDFVRQLASRESIEVRADQFLPAKPLGADYVRMSLGMQFQCRFDQLVNFLRDIAESPKYLAVQHLTVQPLGGTNEKQVSVTMQVYGVMRAELPKKEN